MVVYLSQSPSETDTRVLYPKACLWYGCLAELQVHFEAARKVVEVLRHLCVNFDQVTIVVSWSCWTGRQVITGAACGQSAWCAECDAGWVDDKGGLHGVGLMV